jgi:hypothetical protein
MRQIELDPMIFSCEQEVSSVNVGRPHVVLLGAGASAQACPHGDKYGRRLPVMNDLVVTVGLERKLGELGVDYRGKNFEELYSCLAEEGNALACQTIEFYVREYFEDLELPDFRTIYDDLILSLRSKDVIATFNWDPLLWQAVGRNFETGAMPVILCLHGNVATGYCASCNKQGAVYTYCQSCGGLRQPSRLLFPTKRKNYADDPILKKQWDGLRLVLKRAFVLTIFGYGAPASDVEAVELLKDAWGEARTRNLEEIEIIDIKSDEELRRTWSPFIHTHHYRTTDDYYKSFIANHPRRTCEAMFAEVIGNEKGPLFIKGNPVPRELELAELREWVRPLLEAEGRASPDTGTSQGMVR